MQIFIKVLTGKTIALEVNPKDTGLDIKKKILEKEDVPVDEQHLILDGKEIKDNQEIGSYDFQRTPCINLALSLRSQITFDTHDVYAVVHNFYESDIDDIDNAKLKSFQYVIPLNEDMGREEMRGVFKEIYHLLEREERIKKDKEHVSDNNEVEKANPIIAIVGVKKETNGKKFNTELYSDGRGIQSLISSSGQDLPYEMSCYVLPDGTSIMRHSKIEEKLNEVNQEFHLFFAEKKRREEIKKNYGEIIDYLNDTAKKYFADLSATEELQLLNGIRRLAQGKQPKEDHMLYEKIKAFDIVNEIENFLVIKEKLKNQYDGKRERILSEVREIATFILKEKVQALEKQYFSGKKIGNDEEKNNQLDANFSEKKNAFSTADFNEFIDRFIESFNNRKILCFFEPPSGFMKKYRQGLIKDMNDVRNHIQTREGKSSSSRDLLEEMEEENNSLILRN